MASGGVIADTGSQLKAFPVPGKAYNSPAA
jgi:hypothetical protein